MKHVIKNVFNCCQRRQQRALLEKDVEEMEEVDEERSKLYSIVQPVLVCDSVSVDFAPVLSYKKRI